MNKETSSRVSSIAARIMRANLNEQPADVAANLTFQTLFHDAKILAGSCMSQDETPGQQPGPGPHKIPNEIHPAPTEFSGAQIAQDQILHFFHYAHLPEKLRATSRMFFMLAAECVNTLPRNAERTVALRKLLEAKDAAVRANLPTPVMQNGGFQPAAKPAPGTRVELGEPREIGGHDEDRDGPIPFGD
jgi:hypothetical protein